MNPDPNRRQWIIYSAVALLALCICCGAGAVGYALFYGYVPIFSPRPIEYDDVVPEGGVGGAETLASDLTATANHELEFDKMTLTMAAHEPTATSIPTSTPTLVVTAVPSRIEMEDELNDLFDCTNGERLGDQGQQANFYIDASALTAQYVPADDTFVINVQFDALSDFLNQNTASPPLFLGGVGTVDSTQPFPPDDPNWFFESVDANVGFNWAYTPGSANPFTTTVVRFTPDGWQSTTDPNLQVTLDGGLDITIPRMIIPPDARFWYISFTNFDACEEIGLDPAITHAPTINFPDEMFVP